MPDAGSWDPSSKAIWQEQIPGEHRAITLRHPAYPFPGRWTTTDPEELTDIAAAYLRKVLSKFGLPADLLDASGSKFKARASGIALTWLPIGLPGPLASVWVRRYRDLSDPRPHLSDRTAIVLAVQSRVANDPTTALGSRLGLRIAAHVSTGGEVRITGSTCSTDLANALDFDVESERLSTFFNSFFASEDSGEAFRAELKDRIRETAGLNPDEDLWLDGLRVRSAARGGPSFIEMYSNVQRPAAKPAAWAYAVTTKLLFLLPPFPGMEVIEKVPLVAHAVPVKARLFRQDPASQAGPGGVVDARANRSPRKLETFRHQVALPGLHLDGSGNTTLLDGEFGQVEVMQSKLVAKTADESQPEIVAHPAGVPHARTNPFAALSGYLHGRELFDAMRDYGLQPTEYFRLAAFPLRVRYRATITPGPGKDGKTVNAQVDYDPPGSDLWQPLAPRPLQVRFALADLKRSSSRREPLGLTPDPRWSWHEYCHVLLAASTGALEFPFAHSAGDALAAIRWDPLSHLAVEPPPHPRVRMATFPWVYLNRRHDRSVYAGWSWCGTYHRPLRLGSGGGTRRRKGYQSEQILSTSLFRLYRALGGDTVKANGQPDNAARKFASDYTVYLIMRAIAWLGPASMVPAETPDQFVSALTDADVGTDVALWAGPTPLGRIGGCAHKVVRWAFEAQGLYATTDPLAIVDAPGMPPDIDVFIDNGRPNSQGGHPRGGYMPVSLHWHASPSASPWHATGDALAITNDKVSVKVRNRGQSPATGVVVRVSYIKWPAAQDPPAWDRSTWTALVPSTPHTVPAGGEVLFGPFTGVPTQQGRYLVLAEATCPGDPANTDSVTTMLPCSTQPTPIVDLVAGDNNLGLRLHRIP